VIRVYHRGQLKAEVADVGAAFDYIVRHQALTVRVALQRFGWKTQDEHGRDPLREILMRAKSWPRRSPLKPARGVQQELPE
jgi:hypothetical protein